MPISSLVPDVRVLLALEPAEVAAVMLEYLNSKPPNENLGNVSLGTCISGDNLVAYPAQQREDAERAFAEGWMWLLSEGMVADKPGDHYHLWCFITRKGRQFKTRAQVAAYRTAGRLPRAILHPVIATKSEPPFLRGEYDTAVFQAFKEVEVAVRTKCGYDEGDYGTDLMRLAFHDETGPLTDRKAPSSERQALAHMFAGAIGSYKNPHSHRNVKIDASETIETLVLASHLMKIVDARVLNPSPAPTAKQTRKRP